MGSDLIWIKSPFSSHLRRQFVRREQVPSAEALPVGRRDADIAAVGLICVACVVRAQTQTFA